MKIALFGRHPSPAEHIVFPEGIPEDKMNDYNQMRVHCSLWLKKTQANPSPHFDMELYVEGFTPALIAFLKAWRAFYGPATAGSPTIYLMHYQPDGTYRSQKWR